MLFKTRFGTPAKGGLTMTVPLVVIVKSEATFCHCEPER